MCKYVYRSGTKARNLLKNSYYFLTNIVADHLTISDSILYSLGLLQTMLAVMRNLKLRLKEWRTEALGT